MTLVTSGLIGRDSSQSAALQSSLESKLVPRLDTAGSTLFKLTWKHKTTPLGRSYLERQASVLRTSGKDFTSWRSPNTRLNGGGDYSDPEKAAKRLEQGHQLNLSEEALIASWPTPQTHDDKLRGNTGADNHSFPHDLSNASTLASWPSPCTPNGGRSISTDQMDATGKTLDGREHTASLEHAVKFSEVRPYGQYPVRFTASGRMLTGSDAAMESSGQLNPEHSLWLQGIPRAWVSFALQAMPSVSRRRRRLSRLIEKPVKK